MYQMSNLKYLMIANFLTFFNKMKQTLFQYAQIFNQMQYNLFIIVFIKYNCHLMYQNMYKQHSQPSKLHPVRPLKSSFHTPTIIGNVFSNKNKLVCILCNRKHDISQCRLNEKCKTKIFENCRKFKKNSSYYSRTQKIKQIFQNRLFNPFFNPQDIAYKYKNRIKSLNLINPFYNPYDIVYKYQKLKEVLKVQTKCTFLSDEGQLCSICYLDVRKKQQIRQLSCKHSFHKECIDKWLSQTQSCPMCRTQLIKGAYIIRQQQIISFLQSLFSRRRYNLPFRLNLPFRPYI